MSTELPPLELFHRIADRECAALRRWIVERGYKPDIDFRNIENSESAAQDLAAHGGKDEVPSLWDGHELVRGQLQIQAHLTWLFEEPYPELLQKFDVIAGEVWQNLQKIIPADLHERFSRIRFLIMDEPDPSLLAELSDELREDPGELCGLHVGTPITQESVLMPTPFPSRIYLFRWALMDQLERDETAPEQRLREEIAITFLHEIGHDFGLEEGDLERLGYD